MAATEFMPVRERRIAFEQAANAAVSNMASGDNRAFVELNKQLGERVGRRRSIADIRAEWLAAQR